MARPSDSWAGLGHLDPDSEQMKRMQKLMSTANFRYLESRAAITRANKQGLPTQISCAIEPSRFTWGFNNVVFEIAFADGEYWIARIQRTPVDSNDTDNTLMASEVATLKLVHSRTTIPVPEVFDYSVSSDNPCGYPYMLLSCLPGQTCNGCLAGTVPREHYPKVAEQLAGIFFELENLAFKDIGRVVDGPPGENDFNLVPCESNVVNSLDFFYEERIAENREIVALHPNDADWLTASWILKIAISHLIIEDRICGPFPLCHLDLHHGNLLFDEEFNITGVLDWSHAQTAPLERLGVFPEFMTAPLLSDEENKQIHEFRDLVIQHLKNKEAAHSLDQMRGRTLLSAFMVSPRAEIAYFCTYSNPRRALWDAKRACKIMFGDFVTWEQLRNVYGAKPLC